jgi:hypothetical protein
VIATRTLSAKGQELLDFLPVYYHDDAAVLAVIDSLARELERVETMLLTLREHIFPQRADDTYGMLAAWEALLGIPPTPDVVSVEARRELVVAYLRKRKSGAGRDWAEALTKALRSASWTHIENAPGPYDLTILIPYRAPTRLPEPKNVQAVASTTGGTIGSETRTYAVTAVNADGETTAAQQASVTTTGPTASVEITWAAVPGATSYRIYRIESGDYLTSSGTTRTDTGSAGTAGTPPTENTAAIAPVASEDRWTAAQAKRLAEAITPAHLRIFVGYDEGFLIGISHIGEELL